MNRLAKGLHLGLGLGSAAFAPCPLSAAPACTLLPFCHEIQQSTTPWPFLSPPPPLPVSVGRCRQWNVSPPRQSCPDALEPSQLGGREGMECGAGGCLSAAGPVPGSILSGHCKKAWLGAVTQPALSLLLLGLLPELQLRWDPGNIQHKVQTLVNLSTWELCSQCVLAF